jgi:hypothetical protein
MNNQDHISPKLSGLKKEPPFKVPAGYFDDFPARMQQRLNQEKQQLSKSKPRVIDFLKPALGLAAGFAAVFLLVYWPVKTLTDRQTAQIHEQRTEEVYFNDFTSLLESLDDETFFSLLEKDPEDDIIETESLVAYLASNFSDYDVFIETQK